MQIQNKLGKFVDEIKMDFYWLLTSIPLSSNIVSQEPNSKNVPFRSNHNGYQISEQQEREISYCILIDIRDAATTTIIKHELIV